MQKQYLPWLYRFGCWVALVIGWLAGSPTALPAQGLLPAEHYSVSDGLAHRQVRDILQDENGFLWIGTLNGLNRFDGYHFLSFRNRPNADHYISNNPIRRLELIQNNKILLLYENISHYFDILDPLTLEHRKVRLLPEDGIKGFPRKIYITPQGRINILTVNQQGMRLYEFDPQAARDSFQLKFELEEPRSVGTPLVNIARMPDCNYLVNEREKGLRMISPEGKVIQRFERQHFECFPEEASYPNSAYYIHRDAQGEIWLAFSRTAGVYHYLPEDRYWELAPGLPADKIFQQVWQDQSGNLLFGQINKDISAYYQYEKLLCRLPTGQVFDFSHLTRISPRIQSVYSPDFFRTIYFGMGNGMSVVQNRPSRVKTFLARELEDYRRGAVMRDIVGDANGKIYFAEEAGYWYKLDLATDRLDTLRLIDETSGEPLSFSRSYALHLDTARRQLWGIGASVNDRGLLMRYDLDDQRLRVYHYRHPFRGLSVDQKGDFWLLTQAQEDVGQLVRFDTLSKAFHPFRDRDNRNPFQRSVPNYIITGHSGAFWIGTNNGLWRIDPHTDSSRYFNFQEKRGAQVFSGFAINVIHQDSSGRLWLGGNDGLIIMEAQSREPTFRILTQEDGLASNTVAGILPDGEGHFWISTYDGLSFYDTRDSCFQSFYEIDGFSHNEFNRFSFHRDFRGRYYFGGVNGLNAFYPADLLENVPPPPLVITKVARYNARTEKLIQSAGSVCNIDRLELSPHDTYFELKLMLPSFTSPQRNRFKVKLENYDPEWRLLDEEPVVNYNKLPAGRYTLKMIGADYRGVWNRNPREIELIVRPVFYRSPWFFVLLLVFGILVAYIFNQYRMSQKLREEKFRTKLSSDLHDEVSGLLAGIAMQADLLLTKVWDEKSKKKLQNIRDTSRTAMSKMSDVIWSIDSRKDRLENLLLRMQEHANEVLNPIGIDFHFHIEKMDLSVKLPVRIRQELYFIFKEAVNNIAKHSQASLVNIVLENRGPHFHLIVHDNGCANGKAGALKSGQGLSNIQMRAHRLDAQLNIEQEDGFTVALEMRKFTK